MLQGEVLKYEDGRVVNEEMATINLSRQPHKGKSTDAMSYYTPRNSGEPKRKRTLHLPHRRL